VASSILDTGVDGFFLTLAWAPPSINHPAFPVAYSCLQLKPFFMSPNAGKWLQHHLS